MTQLPDTTAAPDGVAQLWVLYQNPLETYIFFISQKLRQQTGEHGIFNKFHSGHFIRHCFIKKVCCTKPPG